MFIKDTPYKPVSRYYTGKNINATKGSRSAINTDLMVGGVLVMDPYGHDNGIGCDFTQPQTSHLHWPKFVVTDVLRGSARGGQVMGILVPGGYQHGHLNIDVYCNFDSALGDILKVQNGSFAAIKGTTFPADATNQANTILLAANFGMCNEAQNRNATAGLIKAHLRTW